MAEHDDQWHPKLGHGVLDGTQPLETDRVAGHAHDEELAQAAAE
jgi:hypothetical protein